MSGPSEVSPSPKELYAQQVVEEDYLDTLGEGARREFTDD
jgi:hypothetical protein